MALKVIGNFEDQPNIGHDRTYFDQRDITLDCRFRDAIRIHPSAVLSVGDRIITLSHEADAAGNGTLRQRPVEIGANAWIGAYVTLYNCTIGKHSVVGIGSVVASRDVPDFCMVEGDPAEIIARYENGRWVYLNHPEPLTTKRK